MIFETDVLVIGCGIAGCITALEACEQGFDVTLLGSGSFQRFKLLFCARRYYLPGERRL